jgi:ABC-type multidrug transport system ATPase subunit
VNDGPLISAHNLHYQLPSKRQILAAVNFELQRGEFLAVLGENGAGKTTLLDLLMGFRRLTSGKLMVMGCDPQGAASIFSIFIAGFTLITVLQKRRIDGGPPNGLG